MQPGLSGNLNGANFSYTPSSTLYPTNQNTGLQATNGANIGVRSTAPVLGASTNIPNNIGTTGTGAATPDKAAQINAAYDVGSNYYKGLLPTIDPQKQNDIAHTNQYYGDQLTGLTHQRDAAFQNLDTQTNLANQSYTKGLGQLGNQIRNTYQAQTNALGTQGAGDSSAVGQLGYALGNEQNLQRGYMNTDLNNQMTQIGETRKNDENQFQDQSNQIEDLKQQAYDSIAKTYAQLTQSINTQLAGNEQARLNALTYAGQWAQGQAANINTDIEQRLHDATNAYNPANLPQVAQTPMASYTAHNVVAPTVSVQSDLGRPVDNSPVQQIFSPYKQQQPQF